MDTKIHSSGFEGFCQNHGYSVIASSFLIGDLFANCANFDNYE